MGTRAKRVGLYALRVAVGAVALTALTGGETTMLDDFAEYNGLPVLALPIEGPLTPDARILWPSLT